MRTHQPFRVHTRFPHAAFAIACCWLFAFAGATSASAQVTVDILYPVTETPEGDPLPVAVNVTSASAVTSVEVQAGPHTAALSLSQGTWTGFLPVTSLARGPHQLVVTATNASMQTGQATRTFTLDRLPAITVTSPANYALGSPEVRVTAACADDSGPCDLTVGFVGGPLLAAGRGTIDTLIKPTDGLGEIEFVARDLTNRVSKLRRTVTVNSSVRLTSEQGFTGRILDIDATRALIYEDTSSPAVVRIVNRATNASEVVLTNSNPLHTVRARSFLTPTGALILVSPVSGPLDDLYEWRGGTLTLLGAVPLDSLKVNGQWAIFSKSNAGQMQLTLRDLTTGTDTIVDNDAGDKNNDVSADGRVFFYDVPSYEIFRYEQGAPPTTTQLTTAAPAWSFSPATDGVNVVFTRVAAPPNGPASAILRTGDGTEIVLATGIFSVRPQEIYRVANGWVAFVRPGDGGSSLAWLRAADGTERQLSTNGTATIQGLSDTGEVIFDVSATPLPRQRYLARPDGSIVDLGASMGEAFRIDDEWFIGVGGQLLAVDPTVPARSILSEGATGSFFSTDVAILNPHNSTVPVKIRYLRENAPPIEEARALPALSRTTVHEDLIPGLQATSVSTVVEAPAASPVVVERLMSWDENGYGGHLGTAVDRPRVRWFFAEGAQGFFYTFFLLANSGATKANVTFTFLIEQGTPVTHTMEVAPGERKTVYSGDVAALVNRSFATVVTSDVPIVAERAMYFGDSPLWLGGHGSAGVPEPSYRWFHAEGATGSLFDTFILLANPNPVDVTVNITYTTDKAEVIKRTRVLPPSSRVTINLEDEAPELANTAVATMIETVSYPVVSERAMYWGTTGNGWREAHNSFGATDTIASKWGVAEGRVGGTRGYQTFLLVSNQTGAATELRATFIKEDGTKVVRTYNVAPFQRYNIIAADVPELADSNFSTLIESITGVPITVESSIYWNSNGVIWEGGGNTIATRLP